MTAPPDTASYELPPIVPARVRTEVTHATQPMPSYAALYTKIGETLTDLGQVMQQVKEMSGWEGLAAGAWEEHVETKYVPSLAQMSETAQTISHLCGDEQAEYDRAYTAATPMAPVTPQQKVCLVQDDHSGANPGAIEKWLEARAAHERDTTITYNKLNKLELPEGGDEESYGDGGGDGPLGKKHDGDDGGRGEGGSHTSDKSVDPKPEDPKPTEDAPTPSVDPTPTDTAPTTAPSTPAPTTTPVSDRTAAANTNLSSDAAPSMGASALSSSPTANGSATPQAPLAPTTFVAGNNSVSSNPANNPANNPATRQQKKQEATTQDNLGKLFDATSGVAAGAVMGAPDHAGTPPTTNPVAGVPAGGQPTPQPTAVDRIAAAQQQQQAQQVAAGGLGSGAGLKAAQGGIGSEPKKPPNIPAADKPNDDPKPTKNDKDGKQQ